MPPFSGIILFGLPIEVSVMVISGILYAICAIYIFQTYHKQRNELIGSILAFFVYQAIAMAAMGLEWYTHNIIYGIIATLAILVGSAYMLKFPFSFFPEQVRRTMFSISILVVLVIFAWLVFTPSGSRVMMSFTIWYDVFINGIVVGFFMLVAGFKASERWLKIKAVGGGTGVASCCIISNVAMVTGSIALSSIFQFLAPIIIISSIIAGRRMQSRPVQLV